MSTAMPFRWVRAPDTALQERMKWRTSGNQNPVLLAIPFLCRLETKTFLTKITSDLVMATPIDSRKSRQTRNAINQSHLKNVGFRDGMGLRLVNGIPCLSAFSGVDRGGHH